MITPKATKGFSLIELLIVIFIVALIYFLGFGAISWNKNSKQTIDSPLQLKPYIQNSSFFTGSGKLICINECKTCYFKTDINTPAKKIDMQIDLGSGINIYKLDHDDMMNKIDFGRFKDKKICLLMDFYKNGSSTQMVFENTKAIYFLSAYFNNSQEVDSVDDAKNIWLKYNKNLHNQGDFY